MNYDIIDGSSSDYGNFKFFTIGMLIDTCKDFPNTIVKFLGTDTSPGELGSWRGSYDVPAIEPDYVARTGKEVASALENALQETHCGYKGGDYNYADSDEFYVSPYGHAHEYKVVKAELEDDILVLYTKLDPY